MCAPVQRVPADEAGEEAPNSCESHNAKALGVYWAAAVLKKERGRISTVERFGNQHR